MACTVDALALWRDRRSDAKRRAILHAAKDVFLSAGFRAASMDAIAVGANVSKMTVYRHFRSKEELFAGLIEDLCSRMIGGELALDPERPVEQVLREYAERVLDVLFDPVTIELHRIVVAESRRFPALGRLFYRSGPEATIRALETYLAALSARRRIAVLDTRASAEEFLEVLRGYAHLRLLLGVSGAPSRRERASRVQRALAHMLGAAQSAPSKRRPRRRS
jgi:TetR/AcrR family transcriptional repressor of mexJK operon